jgi:hypothetical protein
MTMDYAPDYSVLLIDAVKEPGFWRLVCHTCGWKSPKFCGEPGSGGACAPPKECVGHRVAIHDLGSPCQYCYAPIEHGRCPLCDGPWPCPNVLHCTTFTQAHVDAWKSLPGRSLLNIAQPPGWEPVSDEDAEIVTAGMDYSKEALAELSDALARGLPHDKGGDDGKS